MREVAQRITLCFAALVGDFFVAASEAHRLEAKEADDLRIIQRELDDLANLLIVDTVHDGGDGNDVNAGSVQVLDGANLYVKHVADFAVRIGRVADTVKLQVGVTQTRFSSLFAELRTLGKLDAVGCSLYR